MEQVGRLHLAVQVWHALQLVINNAPQSRKPFQTMLKPFPGQEYAFCGIAAGGTELQSLQGISHPTVLNGLLLICILESSV